MSSGALGPARPLRLADFEMGRLDELVRLWREAFEAGVGITDWHPIEEQRQYFLDEVLPRGRVRMALLDDALVGFVAANPESIVQLHVRTSDHRRGIGTWMLEWAKAQSCGSLWLYTFARNTGARSFYEKHGFRIIARGFEPEWQLDDLKYLWSAEPSPDATGGGT